MWSIIEAPARGWTDGGIVAGFAAAAVVLAAFLAWELRTAEPMLTVRFFPSMRFTAASLAISSPSSACSALLPDDPVPAVRPATSPFAAGLRTLPFAGAVW